MVKMKKKNILKVVLDTNMLMLPVQLNINITAELDKLLELKYEIVVPEGVIDELKKLFNVSNPKTQRIAKFALKLAKKFKIMPLRPKVGESTDQLLVRLAKKKDYVICTCDNELRRKIREVGAPVIFLRQMSHLVIEGEIP
ncbi:MAG: PIN domain-containing protein [Candidatus Baldrarchaeota archaeon]|nr:PIN domain-containing protein [Candidatus Baldrarchaeota archaeon]